jgi:hypothetical protein
MKWKKRTLGAQVRFLVLTILVIFLPNAFAGGGSQPNQRRTAIYILCERRLDNKQIEQRENVFNKEFMGRPFILSRAHDMTSLGLQKMGLDPKSTEREIKDLLLVAERSTADGSIIVKLSRYHQGQLIPIQTFTFAKQVPVRFEPIYISDEHDHLTYDEVNGRYPAKTRDHHDLRVGYYSGPDQDGIRHYLVFSDFRGGIDEVWGTVGLGIDVPYEDIPYETAKKYTEDVVDVVDDLRAPTGRFLRIEALNFVRVGQP